MSDPSISLLRQRMIEDMTALRFKEKVQTDYVRHVTNFTKFLGRSPDTATSEPISRLSGDLSLQACWFPPLEASRRIVKGAGSARNDGDAGERTGTGHRGS